MFRLVANCATRLSTLIGSALLVTVLATDTGIAQNAIVGDGFSSGWGGGGCPTGNGNFTFLGASAGTSYIATLNSAFTGNRFFRFGIDWSGTTAQRTITPGSNVAIVPSTTYVLNATCTTSGAMFLNVPNTAFNYIFKTQDAGTNPTGNFVVFEVQGAVRTVTAVSQTPAIGSVNAGNTVGVTATLSGTLSAGQSVYLRYTNDNYATSTVLAMTGGGTAYSANIPLSVNVGGASISYYVFTSGSSNVASNGSNADLFTINLNNNSGSNYNYTIARPMFRSKAAGPANWSAATSWQLSYDNGSTWSDAAITPTATTAESITIQTGHTINIDASVSMDQVTVQSGAVLQRPGGASPALITLNDGTGDDITVNSGGVFRLQNSAAAFDYVNCISYSGSSKILVQSGGTLEVNITAGSEFWRFATEAITRIEYQNNATFYWNLSGAIAFGTNSVTYFPSVAATVIPVFRINNGLSVGSSNTCTINGLLQLDGGTLLWQNAGTKVIRNGVRNTGIFRQDAASGAIQFSGTNSYLGGTGTIDLQGDGLAITAGTCTLENNKTSNNGTISISNGAGINAGAFSLSGTSGFTVNTGATLSTASATGVNGAVLLSGVKTFANNSNYTFTGTANQTTGSFMPTTVAILTVNNTGAVSNNTVSLTNTNTSVTSQMQLTSGLFAIGTGNTLALGNGASLTVGSAGDMLASAAGGNLWLQANNTVTTSPAVSGKPALYDLTIGSGVPVSPSILTSNPTVNHYCTFNSEGSLSGIAAPYYASGSTLIYNTGGSYNRNVEWGQATADQPGYPHHVIVQNNTTLNMNLGGNPPRLAMAGDLQLGNSTTSGTINMNSVAVPLEVFGNLTIGTGTSSNSNLTLSTVFGGDLYLYGNFNRYNNNFFTDNNRATFLKGANSVSINTPGVTITAGTPSQYFSYLYLDKNGIDQTITLNCPVGINQLINFGKGRLISTLTNLLLVTQGAADAANLGVSGGSANSYVDGPMRRYINATNGDFSFPVGRMINGTHYYKGMFLRPAANAGNYFTATYERLVPPQIGNDIFMGNLLGLNNLEYWQIDKLNASPATTTRVMLPYTNPNSWRDVTGASLSPCWFCNVAVVQRSTNSGNGSWFFPNATSGNFSSTLSPPEYRMYEDAGYIATKVLNTFSPFSIGFSYNIVLPVSLLSFDVNLLVPNTAALTWKIDSDKDLAYTVVEHSSDGIKFTPLDSIAANGTNYHYDHRNLLGGRHFYRLRMVEKNGLFTFSKTESVWVKTNQSYIVSIAPNPTSNGTPLTISLSVAGTSPVYLNVYDMAGRLYYQQVITTAQNSGNIILPTTNIASGMYQVILWQNNKVADRRMLKVQ